MCFWDVKSSLIKKKTEIKHWKVWPILLTDRSYIKSIYLFCAYVCHVYLLCCFFFQDYTTEAKTPALLSSGLQSLPSFFFPWEYRKELALVALLFSVLHHWTCRPVPATSYCSLFSPLSAFALIVASQLLLVLSVTVSIFWFLHWP